MRDQVRAALIAVALLIYGVQASPMPKRVRRAQLDSPIGREELGRWVEILGGVGVSTTQDELADRIFDIGTFFADIRNAILGPIGPWFRLSGTGQAWGLFTYPDTYPHQLRVEIREKGGEWHTLYAGLDPEADWNRDVLVYRRVRGVYDGNTERPGPSYDNFANWIGGLALADHPEADEARVGFLRYHTVQPGREQDPKVEAKFWRSVRR